MGPRLGDWGPFFDALNRGKRSIAADITKPAGRDLLLRLARNADVFLENIVGLRRCGPDAFKPGFDALIQGRTGIVSVTGSGSRFSHPHRRLRHRHGRRDVMAPS